MNVLKYFKIGFIGVALLLSNCVSDDIIIADSEYVNGGIGTSQNTGAIEFNFRVPERYASARVGIDLVGNITIREEVNGIGDKRLQFLDLSSKTFDYTFEFWAIDYGDLNAGDLTLGRLLAISKTVEVRPGETLKIDIKLE